MPTQPISELTPEPFDSFTLTDDGYACFVACQSIHEAALRRHYGDSIPEPRAAVQDDGQLVIFWACDNWPICIRIDPEHWSRR